jgi:hypothetical protein
MREMLSRRLLKRILIVPPAGLVGSWHREMGRLFNLEFNIVRGAEASEANPSSSFSSLEAMRGAYSKA